MWCIDLENLMVLKYEIDSTHDRKHRYHTKTIQKVRWCDKWQVTKVLTIYRILIKIQTILQTISFYMQTCFWVQTKNGIENRMEKNNEQI